MPADYHMREAVRLFYLSRRVRGDYADDCVRMSWSNLLCWAAATDGVSRNEGERDAS